MKVKLKRSSDHEVGGETFNSKHTKTYVAPIHYKSLGYHQNFEDDFLTS